MRFLKFSIGDEEAQFWKKDFANDLQPRILCESLATYADQNLSVFHSNKIAESPVPLDAKVLAVLHNNDCTMNIAAASPDDSSIFLITLQTIKSEIDSSIGQNFNSTKLINKKELSFSRINGNFGNNSVLSWPKIPALLRTAPMRVSGQQTDCVEPSVPTSLHNSQTVELNLLELNFREYLKSIDEHWTLLCAEFVSTQSIHLLKFVVILSDKQLCLILWNALSDTKEHFKFPQGSVYCPATVKSCDTILRENDIYVPLYIDLDDQSLLAQVMIHSGAAVADKVSHLNSLNRCTVPLNALKSSLHSRQLDTIAFFLNSWKQSVSQLLANPVSLDSLLSGNPTDQSELSNLLDALHLLENHCRSILCDPDNQWRQLADQLMFMTNSLLLQIAENTRQAIHQDTSRKLKIEAGSLLERLFNQGRSLRSLLEKAASKTGLVEGISRRYDQPVVTSENLIAPKLAKTESDQRYLEQFEKLSRADIIQSALKHGRLALANQYFQSINEPATTRIEIEELTRSQVLKAIGADDKEIAIRLLTCAGFSARKSFVHLLRHTQSSKMRLRLIGYLTPSPEVDDPEEVHLFHNMKILQMTEELYSNEDFIASVNSTNPISDSTGAVPPFYVRIKDASIRIKPSSKFNLDNLLSLCSCKSSSLEYDVHDRFYISLRLNWLDYLNEEQTNRVLLDAKYSDAVIEPGNVSTCGLSESQLIDYLVDHRLIDNLFHLIDNFDQHSSFIQVFIEFWLHSSSVDLLPSTTDSLWCGILNRDWLIDRMLTANENSTFTYSDIRAKLNLAGRSWLMMDPPADYGELRKFLAELEKELLIRAGNSGSTSAIWAILDVIKIASLNDLLPSLDQNRNIVQFVSTIRLASLETTPERIMNALLASYQYIDGQLENSGDSVAECKTPHWLVILSVALMAGYEINSEIKFFNGSLSVENIQKQIVTASCNLLEQFVTNRNTTSQSRVKSKHRKISRQHLTSSIASQQVQSHDNLLISENSYEISLYEVLDSCKDFDLSKMFTWQEANHLTVGKNFCPEIPSFDDTTSLPGHFTVLPNKLGLNFAYYLCQGRPAFAQLSVISQLMQQGYRSSVPTYIVDELSRWTHLLALQHLSQDRILSACVTFQQLLGVNSDLLSSYITIAKWLQAWCAAVNESCSTPDQLEVAKSLNLGELLTDCFNEDRRFGQKSARTLIDYLEKAFEFELEHHRIVRFDQILNKWNSLLGFSDLHHIWPRPDTILRLLASRNNWMEFLIVAQIYCYPKLQVRQSVQYFTVRSLRDHLSYIVEKAVSNYEEIGMDSSIGGQDMEDPFHQLTLNSDRASFYTSNEYSPGIEQSQSSSRTSSSSKTQTNDQSRRGSKPRSGSSSNIHSNQLAANGKPSKSPADNREGHRLAPRLNLEDAKEKRIQQRQPPATANNQKPASGSNTASLSLSRIAEAAPKDLFDLLFLCTARQQRSTSSACSWSLPTSSCTTPTSLWNSVTSVQGCGGEMVRFEWKPLLVHALALSNPLLVVLSRCARGEAEHDKATDRLFLASFMIASIPQGWLTPVSRFHMNEDQPKLQWNHNDVKTLLEMLVTNRACAVAAEAFKIFMKISPLGAFFSYLSFSVDKWNLCVREKEKSVLIEACERLDSLLTSEPFKLGDDFDVEREWMAAICNSCLDAALDTILTHYGSRLLLVFLKDWNSIVTMNPSVRKFLNVKDNNTHLLEDVLKMFTELSDSLKIQLLLNDLPINAYSTEFSIYCCQLIETHFIGPLPPWLHPIRERLCNVLSPRSRKLLDKLKRDDEQNANTQKLLKPSFKDSGMVQGLLGSVFAGSNDIRVSSLLANSSLLQNNFLAPSDSLFDYPVGSAAWKSFLVVHPEFNKILTQPPSNSAHNSNNSPEILALNKALDREQLQEAIGMNVYSRDLLIISYCVRLCCNQVKVSDLPDNIQNLFAPANSAGALARRSSRPAMVRRSSFMGSGMHRIDSYLNFKSNISQSGNIISILEKLIGHLQHGRSIAERIYSLACVAEQMKEPYDLVVKGEELDVLSKILSGAASDKLATADHYLTAIEMDSTLLRDFLACTCLHVIRLESGSQLPLSFVSHCSNSSTPSSSWVLTQPHSYQSSDNFNSPLYQRNSQTSMNSMLSDSSVTQFSDQVHRYAKNVARRCWNKLQCVTSHRELSLRSLVLLSGSPSSLGKILLDTMELCRSRDIDDITHSPDMEYLVDSLVLSHICYSEAGNTEGISHCLRVAKELVRLLTSGDHYSQMTRLVSGIGRYSEMTYVFDILTEKHQFELLLRQDVGKDGKIIPAIFEYLSRYQSENLDLAELVCLKYNLGRELAETKEAKALLAVKKLGASMNKSVGEAAMKNLCFDVVQLYVDASHAFKIAQCYRHALSCFRKAQLFSLQSKWLQRPSNQTLPPPNIQISFSATGSSSGISSPSSATSPGGAVTMPGTGLTNGVRVFDMGRNEARHWMLCNSVFYESYILVIATGTQDDIWALLLCEHVLLRGDLDYMQRYVRYYSRLVSPILKNIIFYFNRHPTRNSKHLVSLRHLLKFCDDQPLINKYRKDFNITDHD